MFRSIRSKRHAARATTNRRHLHVNLLDERTLPSVSATLFDGTLFVAGSRTGPAADQIRIVGNRAEEMSRAFDTIRVYDGAREIGAFAGVQNIDVRPGGNSTLAVDLNAYRGINTLAIAQAYDGTNIVRIGEGAVRTVTFTGGSGSEVVTVDGLTANGFKATAGAGADHFRFGSGNFGQIDVREAESAFLTKTAVGMATFDNANGTMVVESTAFIAGDLRVFTGVGALTVGGTVGGNVEYESFGLGVPPGAAARFLPARAELVVGGTVGGSLRMISHDTDDTAWFTDGSAVAGSVRLEMGAGNDSAMLGGTIGGGKGAALVVNMGEGQDSFTLLETAWVMTPDAMVILGEGDDFARVEYGAQFFTLVIYGGNGLNTFDLNGMGKQVVVIEVGNDK